MSSAPVHLRDHVDPIGREGSNGVDDITGRVVDDLGGSELPRVLGVRGAGHSDDTGAAFGRELHEVAPDPPVAPIATTMSPSETGAASIIVRADPGDRDRGGVDVIHRRRFPSDRPRGHRGEGPLTEVPLPHRAEDLVPDRPAGDAFAEGIHIPDASAPGISGSRCSIWSFT
jgi:hypothetical protein